MFHVFMFVKGTSFNKASYQQRLFTLVLMYWLALSRVSHSRDARGRALKAVELNLQLCSTAFSAWTRPSREYDTDGVRFCSVNLILFGLNPLMITCSGVLRRVDALSSR